MADARGRTAVAAVAASGAFLALVGLAFPPLLHLDGVGQLGALGIQLATGTTLGATPSGLRLLEAGWHAERGLRDPAILGMLVAAGGALLVLLAARAPRLARALAFVGMAGVGAIQIAPRLVSADSRGWCSTLVVHADPGLGYYLALAGFGVTILAGTLGGARR